MDDALRKAAQPYEDVIYMEIQVRLNKLNKLVPIDRIIMGMGGWAIKHPPYEVACADCDTGKYSIDLDDLQEGRWDREDVPKPILKLVDELRELLDFIDVDNPYLIGKDFFPN